MKRAFGLILITAAVAGCGSTATGSVPNPTASASFSSAAAARSSAEASFSSAMAAASASASSQMCTTKACIVDDLDQSLTGQVAQDEAVATKVACRKSTVKFHAAADTYSAYCVVTYSDGSEATGTGNLLVGSQQVTFEPTG